MREWLFKHAGPSGLVIVAALAVGLVFIAAIAMTPAAGSGEAETEGLRKVLLQAEEGDPYGLSVPSDNPCLKAIERLTSLSSPEAVAVLKDFLTTYGANRKLKQHALVALGKIGTKEAVEAIRELEEWAEKVRLNPPDFRFGKKDHAIDHFGPQDLKPLAKAKDEDGREWAIFRWSRFGTNNLWITESRAEGRWGSPILLSLPDLPEVTGDTQFALKSEKDTFILGAGDHRIKFTLKDQVLDHDKDGLSDAVEQLLETDPKNPDSDSDGAVDGKDSNPLTPKHRTVDGLVEIRQAVFFVLFATSNSQDAVVIVGEGEFAEQEYYGYGGFVLKSPKIRHGFVNVRRLTVKVESPTTARAEISDWEGDQAASGHEAKLRKIHGKWVVVEFEMTRIS